MTSTRSNAPVFSSEGRLNTKSKRIQDCRKQPYFSQFPNEYKSNSTKEELCLEYVNSFTEQFLGFYPNRRRPPIIIENECGVKKFVCSTIRPTELPYPELHDMYECASFLAGYLIYEPLDPQTELPRTLFSPTEVLKSNAADSFEMSTLLCSCLVGANYDAYVVNGYAPKFITLRDQSMTICPMIAKTQAQTKTTAKSESTLKAINSEDYSYKLPVTPIMESQFLADEIEKSRISALDTFKLWIPDAYDKNEASEDGDNIKRVHSWVLICAGRRDVKEHIFLEPSTGRVYPVANSPYIGIESIWNNTNYWMHLQHEKKVSEISFDFANIKNWENLFLYGPKAVGDDSSEKDEDDQKDKNAEVEALQTIFDSVKAFDAPPTWVSELKMERSGYLLRYPPHGKRSIQYHCAKADFFAKGVHPQSLVMRIIIYLNKERTIVNEIHEWFESRRDKMFKRVRYYLDNYRFVEEYLPGSVGEVKKWTEYPGKASEIDFYVDGRLDRLSRRVETIGKKIVEYFEGRTDHLVFRSVILTIDKSVAGQRQFALPGRSFAPEIYVLKMTQRFSQNHDVVSGSDISKRTFFVREGKVLSEYHFAKNQITGAVKTYLHTRGPSVPGVSDHALAQEIGLVEDLDELQESASIERECFAAIKTSLQALQKIEDYRHSFEQNVQIERNVFEVALNKAAGIVPVGTVAVVGSVTSPMSSSDKFSNNNETKQSDYLAPYLRNVKDPSKINKEDALEIRQTCLDALKLRLIERANIIQSRLNDENAKLGRKQEQFQRSQREGDLSTEEYEKYCTEAMFRIQILEQRLAKHEESALKKFSDLDSKLGTDPRLKVLKQ
jgi:hypothetical protein